MWIKEIIIDEKEIFKKVDIRGLFCSCLIFSNMTNIFGDMSAFRQVKLYSNIRIKFEKCE